MEPLSIILISFIGWTLTTSILGLFKNVSEWWSENDMSHSSNCQTITREDASKFFMVAKMIHNKKYKHRQEIVFNTRKGRETFYVPPFNAFTSAEFQEKSYLVSVKPNVTRETVGAFVVSHKNLDELNALMDYMENTIRAQMGVNQAEQKKTK